MLRRIKQQSGFVLVSVIWLLVILSLAFVAFSAWVDNSRNNAVNRQQQINAKILGTTVFNRVMYTYMTGDRAINGITLPADRTSVSGSAGEAQNNLGFASVEDNPGESASDDSFLTISTGVLAFSGEIIDVGSGVRVMLQDRAGLIGLYSLRNNAVFSSMLQSSGVQASASELHDILMDYQDSDSIPEDRGAEDFQYEQLGLPVPANGALRTPLQLRALLLWGQVLASFSDAWLLETFKVDGSPSVNANTASDDVIRLLIPDGQLAEQIIAARSNALFRTVRQIPTGGLDFDQVPLYLGSGGGFRFWRWHVNHPIAEVYDVQFDDLSPGKDAIYLNWVARVPVPEYINDREVVKINHAFFN